MNFFQVKFEQDFSKASFEDLKGLNLVLAPKFAKIQLKINFWSCFLKIGDVDKIRSLKIEIVARPELECVK